MQDSDVFKLSFLQKFSLKSKLQKTTYAILSSFFDIPNNKRIDANFTADAVSELLASSLILNLKAVLDKKKRLQETLLADAKIEVKRLQLSLDNLRNVII